MKYLGGKHKIGKKIAHFLISKCPADEVNGYLEPFCGSLGVFKHMTNSGYKKCIASDIQPDLIEMWKRLQKGTLKIPDEITEEDYNRLKNLDSNKPNTTRAIAGFFLSFGGKYFAGYSQKWAGSSGRDFLQEFKNGIDKIKPQIQHTNVIFEHKSYNDWEPHNMLIYCDPPYQGTEAYSSVEKFDHDKFWETMRKWSKNNKVFISEETAPKDFKSIWSKQKRRTLDKENRDNKKEHLFVYNNSKFTKKNNHKNFQHRTTIKNN
jgi:site-specific DNA-adenine methylase